MAIYFKVVLQLNGTLHADQSWDHAKLTPHFWVNSSKTVAIRHYSASGQWQHTPDTTKNLTNLMPHQESELLQWPERTKIALQIQIWKSNQLSPRRKQNKYVSMKHKQMLSLHVVYTIRRLKQELLTMRPILCDSVDITVCRWILRALTVRCCLSVAGDLVQASALQT